MLWDICPTPWEIESLIYAIPTAHNTTSDKYKLVISNASFWNILKNLQIVICEYSIAYQLMLVKSFYEFLRNQVPLHGTEGLPL